MRSVPSINAAEREGFSPPIPMYSNAASSSASDWRSVPGSSASIWSSASSPSMSARPLRKVDGTALRSISRIGIPGALSRDCASRRTAG